MYRCLLTSLVGRETVPVVEEITVTGLRQRPSFIRRVVSPLRKCVPVIVAVRSDSSSVGTNVGSMCVIVGTSFRLSVKMFEYDARELASRLSLTINLIVSNPSVFISGRKQV